MIVKIHYVSGAQTTIFVPKDEIGDRISKLLEHDLTRSIEVIK